MCIEQIIQLKLRTFREAKYLDMLLNNLDLQEILWKWSLRIYNLIFEDAEW